MNDKSERKQKLYINDDIKIDNSTIESVAN